MKGDDENGDEMRRKAAEEKQEDMTEKLDKNEDEEREVK